MLLIEFENEFILIRIICILSFYLFSFPHITIPLWPIAVCKRDLLINLKQYIL